MIRAIQIDRGITLITGYVNLLEKAERVFEQEIGRPEYTREQGIARFRYKTQSAQIFQVVKGVRVVSSYNACLCLVRQGYTQEACALIRMVFEFLHDMDFIADGVLKGMMSVKQQEMLDIFFEEDVPVMGEQLGRHAKKKRVPRKNVYAEVAKGLNPQNPDKYQRIMRMLEEVYSGYVHASYPTVMELYVGQVNGRWGFFTNGMEGTPRHLEGVRAIVRSIHQALNQFARLAAQFNKLQLFNELIEQRKKLEASGFYGKAL